MLCASCACWLLYQYPHLYNVVMLAVPAGYYYPVSSPVQCCVLAVPAGYFYPVFSPVQCCVLAVPAGLLLPSIPT
ncbi:hypothetical protein DPMN_076535 [Dreissena polymorpha]|uniref:Uncharacterized protein n=1 Tax=Dreissena polymorpha TaxID=45954 RepID=A0A9D3YN92_DREPO|nr:hypothetical protein DPMN_076535 [Dreissena polymorpha]